MKLEQQVCSLEYARKLKELGVKQASVWWWFKGELYKDTPDYKCSISAFTVAELGEMLPYNKCQTIFKNTYRNGKIEYLFYIDPNTEKELLVEANTEANCRAKMLIYLLENKLTT